VPGRGLLQRGTLVEDGYPLIAVRGRVLFRFVLLEELSRFFEVERVSVDDQLVFSGIIRDRDDSPNAVTVLPEGLNDKVDVYHACKSTRKLVLRHPPKMSVEMAGWVENWVARSLRHNGLCVGVSGRVPRELFASAGGVGSLKLGKSIGFFEETHGPE